MSTTGKDLARVIGRELDHVAEEIAAYRDERNLWVTQGAQLNAPGTLALHLAGNLQHYVGAGLGNTGYVRDRTAEFHDRDVPRAELLERLREARDSTVRVLSSMDEEAFATGHCAVELPEAYRDMTVRALIIHLTWHLGWHQGQIYYHRLAVEPPETS
ncbi:MAG: DinB family protein [Gemmatimonadota bacterium]